MRSILVVLMTAVLVSPQQFPRDPLKEMQKRAEKASAEKNYQELKDAAAELLDLSKQISAEVDEGGKDVISVRIFDRLDRVDKLTKRIRDKAKGGNALVPRRN